MKRWMDFTLRHPPGGSDFRFRLPMVASGLTESSSHLNWGEGSRSWDLPNSWDPLNSCSGLLGRLFSYKLLLHITPKNSSGYRLLPPPLACMVPGGPQWLSHPPPSQVMSTVTRHEATSKVLFCQACFQPQVAPEEQRGRRDQRTEPWSAKVPGLHIDAFCVLCKVKHFTSSR